MATTYNYTATKNVGQLAGIIGSYTMGVNGGTLFTNLSLADALIWARYTVDYYKVDTHNFNTMPGFATQPKTTHKQFKALYS